MVHAVSPGGVSGLTVRILIENPTEPQRRLQGRSAQAGAWRALRGLGRPRARRLGEVTTF